ncbi:MAG TPA: 4'-phosphopantetheinyl transferase superfamily protein [Vicinamibacterales bacterium]|jgi:4'-phosphopantetheinyl transferase
MREILIWRVDLVGSDQVLRRCWEMLAPDERARADRFHSPRERAQFIVARGALRSILGDYLGASPRRLEFRRSPFGKPSLVGPSNLLPDFNVSRASDVMVCAIAERARVGIDIETVGRTAGERDESAYFSPVERDSLGRLAPDRRAEAIAVCWTRKEAFIKAHGEGLSFPLDAFDVSVHPDPPRVLATRPDRDEAARWSLYDLAMGSSAGAATFVGTVAVEGQGWTITRLEWRFPRD